MKLSLPLPLADWPWPLPAVLCWATGFAVWRVAALLGAGAGPAWLAGLVAAGALALACRGRWRQGLAAVGFPLASLALMGLPAWPAWVWGVAVLLLLLLYPLSAWRDAPWFPTPQGALRGLNEATLDSPPQSVMDAGCGLGHGLRELRLAFPQAVVHGVERSRPLRWAASWCCPWARVQGGDLWASDWSRHELIYVFQRPESMARAHAKAMRELPGGGWLASLEFEVPGVVPTLRLPGVAGRPVWLYLKPLDRSTMAAGCR
jgi:hypothetical protein